VFSDRAVLNKERVSGYYRLSAYYIAKNVSGIPVMLILPSILFTIVFWSTGLNRQFAVYAQLTLLLYLSCIVANVSYYTTTVYNTLHMVMYIVLHLRIIFYTWV